MKLLSAFLLAVCLLPTAHVYAEECGLNQATLDQRANELLQRHPGGRMNKEKRRVTWRQNDGGQVSVQHAGCMDLVTEIRVVFSSGKPVPEREAVEKLLSAVRTYWDRARADAVAEQIAVTSLPAKREERRYEITVTPQFASVSWLDG